MNTLLPKLIGFYINFVSYFSSKYAAHLAIKIFSTPRKGRLIPEEENYLKSASKEVVFYNDIPLTTYNWLGKKDTVLLVHGWESNSFRWKDLIEILRQKEYNIISMDAPAHGGSGSKIFNAPLYSKCINAVAEKFKVDAIVGHSVGGTASLVALHNYKLQSVKKIVSLGAPSNFVNTFNNYTGMMGYNKRVLKAIDKSFLKRFGFLIDYFKIANFSEDNEAEILLIHDKKDRIISYRDALENKKYLKDAELIKTIGLGHGLKSDKVYQHILDFLKA